jgi:hypothetical protein
MPSHPSAISCNGRIHIALIHLHGVDALGNRTQQLLVEDLAVSLAPMGSQPTSPALQAHLTSTTCPINKSRVLLTACRPGRRAPWTTWWSACTPGGSCSSPWTSPPPSTPTRQLAQPCRRRLGASPSHCLRHRLGAARGGVALRSRGASTSLASCRRYEQVRFMLVVSTFASLAAAGASLQGRDAAACTHPLCKHRPCSTAPWQRDDVIMRHGTCCGICMNPAVEDAW